MIIDKGTLKTTDIPEVLIVDDEPTNLIVLEGMLEGTHCKVIRAHSADEALLKLLNHDFAAIVLDIKMPGIGGIELATLIKQRKRSQHIPILFLTAYMVDHPDILRGYGAGAVDFLSKPIDAGILRSKIGVFIELFRKSRELRALNEALQREIAHRRQAQEELQLANQELERRVWERTAELRRAHQGVRENEERLRMAMDVARIGAWEWHLATGRMIWSTDPEVFFGFPKGSFGPDLRPVRMLHPEDKIHIEDAFSTALTTGAYEAEYRSVRPDGSIIWFTERGRVVADPDGKPERMVGITRDITAEREAGQERERLLREAREARDEAETASRAKSQLLTNVSHELRTPLNAIIGYSDLLLEEIYGPLDGEKREPLHGIQRNAFDLLKLLNEVLDLSTIEAGKLSVSIGEVGVAQTIRDVVAGMQSLLKRKPLSIRLDIEEKLPTIQSDSNKIRQIIVNLLSNAIKFTKEGGIAIAARKHLEKGGIEVSIEDTGIGIKPEAISRIFDAFYQVDGELTREFEGTGLGLAIVKELLQLLNGQIEVESEFGRGSTFRFFLPYRLKEEIPNSKAIP